MIIGVGRREGRLKAALACGADYVIDIDSEDIAARVKEISGGDPVYGGSMIFEGFADSYIDCAGVNEATETALKVLKVGGILSQVTIVNPNDYVCNLHTVCMKNIKIIGGLTDVHYMQYLMDCLKDKKINVDSIITHVSPLSDFNKDLDIFWHKKENAIKVVLKP